MFSPFGEDTLPQIDYDVKKSTFGIVSQSPVLPYLQKLEDFKTVERELLFARESALDSVGSADQDFDIREELGEISDSTALEQQEVETSERQNDYRIPENRNVEQATYDRLFGEYLKAAEEAKRPKKKKEKTEVEVGPQEEEPSPTAEDEQVEGKQVEGQTAEPEPKKKKGLFGGFGKKKKQKKADSEDVEEP